MRRDAVQQAVAAVTGGQVTPLISTGLVVVTMDNPSDPDIAPLVTPGAC
jgi:hypothetical protein